jgi:hypothetical protein
MARLLYRVRHHWLLMSLSRVGEARVVATPALAHDFGARTNLAHCHGNSGSRLGLLAHGSSTCSGTPRDVLRMLDTACPW